MMTVNMKPSKVIRNGIRPIDDADYEKLASVNAFGGRYPIAGIRRQADWVEFALQNNIKLVLYICDGICTRIA
jgi:hypothetical protein